MRKLLSVLLSLCLLAEPVLAFRAGQSVPITFEALNLQGLPATPSAAKLYVFKNGVCIDSTKVLGSGIAALPVAGGRSIKSYQCTYTIPTAMGQTTGGGYFSGQLVFKIKYSITGEFADAPLSPIPALVPVNAAAADTMYADTLDDFWKGTTGASEVVVTPGSYNATAVTSGGLPFMGAAVRLTLDAAGTQLISAATSDASGSYKLRVAVNPTASDTFYLWAYAGTRVVKQAQVITVP